MKMKLFSSVALLCFYIVLFESSGGIPPYLMFCLPEDNSGSDRPALTKVKLSTELLYEETAPNSRCGEGGPKLAANSGGGPRKMENEITCSNKGDGGDPGLASASGNGGPKRYAPEANQNSVKKGNSDCDSPAWEALAAAGGGGPKKLISSAGGGGPKRYESDASQKNVMKDNSDGSSPTWEALAVNGGGGPKKLVSSVGGRGPKRYEPEANQNSVMKNNSDGDRPA